MKKNTYIVILMVIVLGLAFWGYKSAKKESAPTSPATVSVKAITNDTSTAAAVLAGTKTITWETSNYPAGVGVDINLIKMTSASPRKFESMGSIAKNVPNDGQETWVPQDIGDTTDVYIEVACSSAYQFVAGCSIKSEPLKFN